MRFDVLLKRYPSNFSPLLRRSNGIPQPSVLMVRHRVETREQHDRFSRSPDLATGFARF
jgi:hypothetical protein